MIAPAVAMSVRIIRNALSLAPRAQPSGRVLSTTRSDSSAEQQHLYIVRAVCKCRSIDILMPSALRKVCALHGSLRTHLLPTRYLLCSELLVSACVPLQGDRFTFASCRLLWRRTTSPNDRTAC